MPFIINFLTRKSIINSISAMGEKVFFSYDCENIYKPVNSHPDIQIHFVGKREAFVPPMLYDYYKAILPHDVKLHKGNKNLGGTYPLSVTYNISRIGNKVILNLKYADEEIVKYYKNNGFELISVNQGYAKCNICSAGEIAVTEDEGVYKALLKAGIKSLKIPVGDVKLSGFPYGFIGGASGEFKDKILFCGSLKNKLAANFFQENGILVCSLDNEILTDYGSIIYFE